MQFGHSTHKWICFFTPLDVLIGVRVLIGEETFMTFDVPNFCHHISIPTKSYAALQCARRWCFVLCKIAFLLRVIESIHQFLSNLFTWIRK